jgi:hypothetical protein
MLGVWLFFGSKAIAAGWQRMRYAGISDRDEVTVPVERMANQEDERSR